MAQSVPTNVKTPLNVQDTVITVVRGNESPSSPTGSDPGEVEATAYSSQGNWQFVTRYVSLLAFESPYI